MTPYLSVHMSSYAFSALDHMILYAILLRKEYDNMNCMLEAYVGFLYLVLYSI